MGQTTVTAFSKVSDIIYRFCILISLLTLAYHTPFRLAVVGLFLLSVVALYVKSFCTAATKTPIDDSGSDRIVIAFGPSALLLNLHIGIAAYLNDHFILDDVGFTGVSGGCMAALGLGMKLSPTTLIQMGNHFATKIMQRRLLFYFLDQKDIVDLLDDRLEGVLGDADFESVQGRVHFGTSKWSFPWMTHENLEIAKTRRDAFFQIAWSMTILPFFKRPGLSAANEWMFDGCFTSWFCEPKGRVVRIGIATPAHVSYPLNFRNLFVDSWLFSKSRQRQLFVQGYECGLDHEEVFLKAGLKRKATRHHWTEHIIGEEKLK